MRCIDLTPESRARLSESEKAALRWQKGRREGGLQRAKPTPLTEWQIARRISRAVQQAATFLNRWEMPFTGARRPHGQLLIDRRHCPKEEHLRKAPGS